MPCKDILSTWQYLMNDKFSIVCQSNQDMRRKLKHSYWVCLGFLQTVTFRNLKVNLAMFPFIFTILSTSVPKVWRSCDYYLLFCAVLLLYISPVISKHHFTFMDELSMPHTSAKLLWLGVFQICCNNSFLNFQPIWNPIRCKRLISIDYWELTVLPCSHSAICLFFSPRLFSSGST